jgi:hypothetical protein
MKLSQQNQNEFHLTGITALRSFIPTRKVDAARSRLLEDLRRLNLFVDGKWQSKKISGISPFQVSNGIGQKLSHFVEYEQLIPDHMDETLRAIAGEDMTFESTRPQMLVTPPQKEPWVLPTIGWHVDVSTRSVLPGMQVFVLLDELAPKGGATLALKASHLNRELIPEAGTVLEMSGKAGDVFVMDMRVLHTPSINATKKARLMMTCRYLVPGVQDKSRKG